MTVYPSLFYLVAFFSFFAMLTQARAEFIFTSARDVQRQMPEIEEAADRQVKSYYELANKRLDDMKLSVLSQAYFEAVKSITTQTTVTNAEFAYFPGFPKTDARHDLGPGWIYRPSDPNEQSLLAKLILFDAIHDSFGNLKVFSWEKAITTCGRDARPLRNEEFEELLVKIWNGTKHEIPSFLSDLGKRWYWTGTRISSVQGVSLAKQYIPHDERGVGYLSPGNTLASGAVFCASEIPTY